MGEVQMKRFIQGESRTQSTLLPELLDDYIAETNPVRVVITRRKEQAVESPAESPAESAGAGPDAAA